MSDSPPPAARRNSCLVRATVVLTILGVLLAGLWWWHNRPITPVVLNSAEKTVVEAKVEAIQNPEAGPAYEKGSKEIILTERELNGLLNQNTSLGKSVRFELARDAIHARVETDLDPGLPVVGGRHLKARARFLVSQSSGRPALILDDLTVWGVSLPNDWLGGLKGHDLLGETLGGENNKLPGIEEFRIEPGKLTLRLAE